MIANASLKATVPASAPVTTIVIESTGSSSVVYTTSLTVPQVAFTTSASEVGVVPVTSCEYPLDSSRSLHSNC